MQIDNQSIINKITDLTISGRMKWGKAWDTVSATSSYTGFYAVLSLSVQQKFKPLWDEHIQKHTICYEYFLTINDFRNYPHGSFDIKVSKLFYDLVKNNAEQYLKELRDMQNQMLHDTVLEIFSRE